MLASLIGVGRYILKVGWVQYPIAREKFTTKPTLCQTTSILYDRDCYRVFLDEKMNGIP